MTSTVRLMRCGLLLAAYMVAGPVFGAADYIPDDRVLQLIEPREARQRLQSLSPIQIGCFNCEAQWMKGIQLVDGSHLQFARPTGAEPLTIPLSAIQVEVERFGFGSETGIRLSGGWWIWMGRNFEGAKQIADALFVLKKYASGYEDPRVEADFQNAAQVYRESSTKPEFPEAARRYRVRAEAAVRDKEFEDAADNYAEALRVAQWWPEGRFNRALILAELKRYPEAMREMKRYLLLVPDAPNARAAQDKIYEWEGRAGRK